MCNTSIQKISTIVLLLKGPIDSTIGLVANVEFLDILNLIVLYYKEAVYFNLIQYRSLCCITIATSGQRGGGGMHCAFSVWFNTIQASHPSSTMLPVAILAVLQFLLHIHIYLCICVLRREGVDFVRWRYYAMYLVA